jgi:hypothetical protein
MKVEVKLSLCLTRYYAIKDYWGSEGIAPQILNLDTDGSCHLHSPATITPGENPRYPLDRRLGESQSRCERGRPDCSLVTILSQL